MFFGRSGDSGAFLGPAGLRERDSEVTVTNLGLGVDGGFSLPLGELALTSRIVGMTTILEDDDPLIGAIGANVSGLSGCDFEGVSAVD